MFAGTWECAHAVEQSSALPQAGVAALLVEHGADSLALDGSGLSGSFLFFCRFLLLEAILIPSCAR